MQAQKLTLLIQHEKTGSIDSPIANDFNLVMNSHMNQHNIAFIDLLNTPTPRPAAQSSHVPQPAFVLDPEAKWHSLYTKASMQIQAEIPLPQYCTGTPKLLPTEPIPTSLADAKYLLFMSTKQNDKS